MKKLLLLLLLLTGSVFAQMSSTGVISVSASACTTTLACVQVHLFSSPNFSTTNATVSVTGSFTGTLQFEGSADNQASWVSIPGTPSAGGSAVTNVTAAGTWTFSIAAYTDMRVRASAFSANSATVTIQASTTAQTVNNNFFASGGGVANINTADQGFVISTAEMGYVNATAANNAVVAVGQEVRVYQIVLPKMITVSKVTISVQALVASSTITVGIYSPDGNTKLLDSGTFDGGSTGVKTNTITPVTLNPGTYFFAQSASTQTTLTVGGVGLQGTLGSILNNQTVKKVGLAANSATAGVLPSTLGTITAGTTVNPVWAAFER